jgi:DMSO reductase family type II enzyme chaperone
MNPSPQHEASLAAERCLDRIATWKFLHDLFRAPSEPQWRWLQQEAVGQMWRQVVVRTSADDVPREIPLPRTAAAFEEDYLATFEVGLPHPPCPLIESHWNKREPLAGVLHENILFYRRFGLELSAPGKETADHLLHQLEFVQYLYHLEATFDHDTDREKRDQIAHARRDFLERHIGYWVPVAAAALEEACPGSWALGWMSLLRSCCEAAA